MRRDVKLVSQVILWLSSKLVLSQINPKLQCIISALWKLNRWTGSLISVGEICVRAVVLLCLCSWIKISIWNRSPSARLIVRTCITFNLWKLNDTFLIKFIYNKWLVLCVNLLILCWTVIGVHLLIWLFDLLY